MKNSDALKVSVGEPAQSTPDSGVDAGAPSHLTAALHEVSNALTVVMGWLDSASAQLGDHPASEALEVALSHARLGHRVARQAIGAPVPRDDGASKSSVDLAKEALLAVQPAAAVRGVQLTFEAASDAEALVQGATAGHQVLTNLLLNAIEFSPSDGTVTMSLRRDVGRLVFSVRDQGPGVDSSRIASLFAAPRSTRPGGAGIGLRHSREVARQQGGDLVLVGSGPGACFELTWPLRSRVDEPKSRSTPKRSLNGVRVLVLEDDPAVQSLLEVGLEVRGALTITVGSLEEFKVVMNGQPLFDAALLDLSPIVDDIPGVLAALQANNPSVKSVLISGQPAYTAEEADTQFDAWVRKPFELTEVVDTLSMLLSAAR